ncbi:MAG: hypothetical protein NC406_03600 [Bacteroides sp.]|nr:hypothetical protein [Bacteroides sp.]MCM1095438.1 hypothetical protein [Terasakiella sp.]
MRRLLTALLPALAAALGGCFTGIESTPRISGDDVRRADVHVTAEQQLMHAVAAEPPAQWRRGKRWLVGDDRISLVFAAPLPAGADSLAGRVLRLDSMGRYPGISGDTLLAPVFVTDAGARLTYRTAVKAEALDSLATLELPFAIELSAVEAADSLLRGRTVYITTPQRLERDGRRTDGLRHVPVTVLGVEPGTVRYPLRVVFADVDSATRSVMLTYGDGPAATRNFDRLFSFTDPRHSYPRITPATWEHIMHSRVTAGMTRDECRLALGAPQRIDRNGGHAGQYERWSYDQGIYLIFEDGFLIKYRQ